VKFLTKVKNEDGYIIPKTILGEGITYTHDLAVTLIPIRKRS
jgi:hypothetical protein